MEAPIKIADAAGKTIARTVLASLSGSLAIFFTDGTFAYLEAVRGWDGAEIQDGKPGDYEMKEVGIISSAEYDRRKKEENDKRAAITAEHEKKQYELLKAKYGPKP